MDLPARRRRAAFTLVEMVAAIVLMTIMMMVLSSVLWSITRQTQGLVNQSAHQSTPEIAIASIHDDLIAARGMLIRDGAIDLRGFFPPDGVPSTIRYSIDQVAGRPTLVRQSQNGTRWVWLDVGTFTIEPLVDANGGDEAFVSLVDESATPLPPIAEVFRVTLTHRDGSIIYRQMIRHHGS